MATLLPTSQSTTSVEAYEDMFKEITRKLYGEESAHGLYPHNTQVAQLAPGTPLIPEADQQRSFTTLVSDRSLAQLEYENAIDNTFKTEDHLSTAFGLAALMQNGFPPPGAILNPVSFGTNGNKQNSNTVNNLLLGSNDNDNKLKTAFAGIATSNTDDRWASTEDLLASWNPSKISNYTTTQKSNIFKSVKPKQEPPCTVTDTSLIQNITNSLMNSSTNAVQQNITKSLASSQVNVPNLTPTVTKRYSCSSCPYSTDRRDLFTRHENIHKEEKPFHCYACLKQFNRADHVKKHFLRMHRDMTYDINKTRKTPAKNNFYNNQTTTQNQNNQVNLMQQQLSEQLIQQQQQQQQQQQISIQTSNATTLNIPSSFTSVAQNIQLNAINNLQSTIAQQSLQQNVVNTLNGLAVVQQQQHQSQNQTQHTQQQQNLLPNNVVIKQEKVEKSPPKKKNEKRFMCCYCSWSGADNWGLKRHLNTHTKPFVCLLCDYKAARSERLATHVFKVHNKKACNKCTFFADDQNQLVAHQLEAHPSDSRTANQRQNSSNNQTITTININNNPSQNITTTVNTNNSSVNVNNSSNNGVLNGGSNNNNHANLNATTNVLRTLQNTFVPNVSALNSTQDNVSTGNVFGSINSSVLSNSTIYTSNSVNNTTNILNNLNQHLSTNNNGSNNNNSSNTNSNANNWRLNANNIISVTLATTGNNTNTTTTNSTSVSTTHATRQKHGAERLFAYFEADGSDPEDYNRQLAMQALNHNKASVAQDFHKAGGQFGNFYAKLHQQQLQQQHHEDQSENDDDEGIDKISYYNNNNNNLKQLSNNNDKEKATSCSPPALPLSNNQSKRRRTTSLTNNDKENFSNPLKSSVFDKLYQKSIANFMQQLVPSDDSGSSDPESNTRLMEFLENNPDLTISRVKSNKPAAVDPLTSPRHNRKQSQPRKIDKVEKSDFSKEALQDKYLNQLVSDTGLKCRECAKDKNCTLDLTYRTKGALLFHRLWRHTERKVRCKYCRKRFDRKYRLKLHWMKTHKNEDKKRKRGRPKKSGTGNKKTTKGGKTGKKRRRRRRFF